MNHYFPVQCVKSCSSNYSEKAHKQKRGAKFEELSVVQTIRKAVNIPTTGGRSLVLVVCKLVLLPRATIILL